MEWQVFLRSSYPFSKPNEAAALAATRHRAGLGGDKCRLHVLELFVGLFLLLALLHHHH
jgi:hypothetical protein